MKFTSKSENRRFLQSEYDNLKEMYLAYKNKLRGHMSQKERESIERRVADLKGQMADLDVALMRTA